MELSVIIPSRNEKYLNQTIQSIKENAVCETEILVCLDGYDAEKVEGVTYISLPLVEGHSGMREGINEMVRQAKGKYIMKLDAHCLLDEGFDQKLIETHQANLVQIPRRLRLDADKWKVIEDGRPPIDYEYILFQNLLTQAGLTSKGFIWATPWDERTLEVEAKIDDLMHFQGSCWFMTKDWFNECGFMSQVYGGFAQEPEEILFTTLERGGRVVVNKNTWYAHLHKNEEQRKWFTMPETELREGIAFSYNHWLREDNGVFAEVVERFMPIPGWPSNWKKILWS